MNYNVGYCFISKDSDYYTTFLKVDAINKKKFYFRRIEIDELEGYKEDVFTMEEPALSVYLDKYFEKISLKKWQRLIIDKAWSKK